MHYRSTRKPLSLRIFGTDAIAGQSLTSIGRARDCERETVQMDTRALQKAESKTCGQETSFRGLFPGPITQHT